LTKNEQVALEVERWNRTPFDPQQCCRGAGVDCKMLPAGIARDLGFPEAQSVYALTRDYDLTRKNGLPHKMLLEGMRALFDPVEEARVEGTRAGARIVGVIPGDVLLLKWSMVPAHLAIVSRKDGFAWHAQIEPNDFVKEASVRSLLSRFPFHSAYRWRD
jgi:hypothetical protein